MIDRVPDGYLEMCSLDALESLELARLNQASMLRAEAKQALGRFLLAEADAKIARWMLEKRRWRELRVGAGPSQPSELASPGLPAALPLSCYMGAADRVLSPAPEVAGHPADLRRALPLPAGSGHNVLSLRWRRGMAVGALAASTERHNSSSETKRPRVQRAFPSRHPDAPRLCLSSGSRSANRRSMRRGVLLAAENEARSRHIVFPSRAPLRSRGRDSPQAGMNVRQKVLRDRASLAAHDLKSRLAGGPAIRKRRVRTKSFASAKVCRHPVLRLATSCLIAYPSLPYTYRIGSYLLPRAPVETISLYRSWAF